MRACGSAKRAGSKGRTSRSNVSGGYPSTSFRCGLAASVVVVSEWTRPMYTPSCTASKRRANAAARSSTTGCNVRTSSRAPAASVCLGAVLWGPLAFDGRPDADHVGARVVELHRLARHVHADRAAEAVRVPLRHVAAGVARADEAVLVVPVPVGLAAAVARDMARDLGMPRRELVDGARDGERTRQRVAGGVEGRQRRQCGRGLRRGALPRHERDREGCRESQRQCGDSQGRTHARYFNSAAGRLARDVPSFS